MGSMATSSADRHSASLTGLADFGQALLAAPLDLVHRAERIHAYACRVVPADVFQLGLFEGDLYRILVWMVDGQPQPRRDFRLDGSAPGLIGWLRDARQPLRVDDFLDPHEALPVRPRYASPRPPRSALFVPLIVGERALGALTVQAWRPNAFTDEDERLLAIIANGAAAALQNAGLYEQAERRAAQLELLAEVGRRVNVLQPLADLYNQAIGLIAERLPELTVRFYTMTGEALDLVAETPGASTESEISRQLATEAARTAARVMREPVEVRHPELHAPLPADSAARAAWPLFIDERVVGVLSVKMPQAAFDDATLALFESLAAQMAFATLEARVYESQQAQAWVNHALLQIAEAIAVEPDLAAAIETVMRLTLTLTEARWLWVYRLAEDARTLQLLYAVGAEDAAAATLATRELALDQETAWLTRQARALPELLAGRLGEAAAFVYPLRARGQLRGVLLAPVADDGGARSAVFDGVARQLALALESEALRDHILAQRQLEREIALAQNIQASFLPQTLPQPPGWDLAAFWHPARLVGGDFYDVIPLRGGDAQGAARYGLVVADVAGNGVPAALYMALSRTLLRSVAIRRTSPASTLTRANELLQADARTVQFLTAIYVIWEPATGRLVLANAGHPPAVVARADGRLEWLPTHGPALAVFQRARYPEIEVTLAPGDTLLLYTDGLTEASDFYGSEFGAAGVEAVLREAAGGDAAQIIAALRAALSAHVGAGEDLDDAAFVVLRRLP